MAQVGRASAGQRNTTPARQPRGSWPLSAGCLALARPASFGCARPHSPRRWKANTRPSQARLSSCARRVDATTSVCVFKWTFAKLDCRAHIASFALCAPGRSLAADRSLIDFRSLSLARALDAKLRTHAIILYSLQLVPSIPTCLTISFSLATSILVSRKLVHLIIHGNIVKLCTL